MTDKNLVRPYGDASFLDKARADAIRVLYRNLHQEITAARATGLRVEVDLSRLAADLTPLKPSEGITLQAPITPNDVFLISRVY